MDQKYSVRVSTFYEIIGAGVGAGGAEVGRACHRSSQPSARTKHRFCNPRHPAQAGVRESAAQGRLYKSPLDQTVLRMEGRSCQK